MTKKYTATNPHGRTIHLQDPTALDDSSDLDEYKEGLWLISDSIFPYVVAYDADAKKWRALFGDGSGTESNSEEGGEDFCYVQQTILLDLRQYGAKRVNP